MSFFKLHSSFNPSGDQPEAIRRLSEGLSVSGKSQTLLGVTGSGKTFTMANVIAELNKPVLVLSHNKTLAAQLYSEFKSFFPENAVEFFISYYDYYLPEAYIPQTDTYIAKDASINENIERLRLSATSSLLERRDVIIVASVSCIYGLGSPEDYEGMCVTLKTGMEIGRDDFLMQLVDIQYERNDHSLERGQFRVRGDSVDVYIPQREEFVRVEFWGDEVEKLSRCNIVTGKPRDYPDKTVFFPCKHFVMPQERIAQAMERITAERDERVKFFEERGMLVEAQRIFQKTNYDMAMLKEIGYCSGVENYSLHLSDRKPGTRPFCLVDFFPDDFLTVIDESHVTLPQVRAMYKADRSRKQTLVDHGFRLPTAMDNRPLRFDEFERLNKSKVFVSATPGDYEIENSAAPVEQVVRPTGLLDPEITIRPLKGQIDDLIAEIRDYAERNERVIATTLTKKSAERLSDYLNDLDMRVKYLHSEIDAIQRVKILNSLRKGEFDCLIGINLLREGIDLPQVALVAILDADKEGFLRSERSLIQVAGRAARNSNGKVILYADKVTDSIKKLQNVTEKRRQKQEKHNFKYSITPKTIESSVKETVIDVIGYDSSKKKSEKETFDDSAVKEIYEEYKSDKINKLGELLKELNNEMLRAAENLEFERAAEIRDKIFELEGG